MILNVHGSLGDQIMLTGIPEAYYRLYGEKTYINGGRTEIWETNPFLINKKLGKEFSYSYNSYPKDYMVYYPIRVFYDLTSIIADRNFVKPNLYRDYEKKKICVVNDQAGWPSRVGYSHFEDLVQQVKNLGYEITYIRNENFRNCVGQCPPREINTYDHLLTDIPLSNLIEVIGTCELYIGYNSGLAQIAGALDIPYVMLDGPVPPINTKHNSCILAPDIVSCRRCVKETCLENCLQNLENINDKIIEVIKNELQ